MFKFLQREKRTASPSKPTERLGLVSSTSMDPYLSSFEGRLGLSVLHEPHPGVTTAVSIIFVHGLGGSAINTWTNTASNTFWPTLLHEDDGLANARISTFSYDANFKNILAAKNALGIADFAGQFLDSLDSHYRKYGNVSAPLLRN
jgi:hypothetical protein